MNAKLRCTKATPSDLQRVFDIRANCAADLMTRYGPGHWGTSPTLRTLEKHLTSKYVFVVSTGKAMVGTFTLSLKRPSFFSLKDFTNPKATAAYLTGLAVEPVYQKKGIGRFCMQSVDRMARKLKCSAIRFDAYDAPAGAAEFYVRCGYERRHKSTFMGVPLIFFERVIS
jgi:GNAT superfamily N-acetyltransferase